MSIVFDGSNDGLLWTPGSTVQAGGVAIASASPLTICGYVLARANGGNYPILTALTDQSGTANTPAVALYYSFGQLKFHRRTNSGLTRLDVRTDGVVPIYAKVFFCLTHDPTASWNGTTGVKIYVNYLDCALTLISGAASGNTMNTDGRWTSGYVPTAWNSDTFGQLNVEALHLYKRAVTLSEVIGMQRGSFPTDYEFRILGDANTDLQTQTQTYSATLVDTPVVKTQFRRGLTGHVKMDDVSTSVGSAITSLADSVSNTTFASNVGAPQLPAVDNTWSATTLKMLVADQFLGTNQQVGNSAANQPGFTIIPTSFTIYAVIAPRGTGLTGDTYFFSASSSPNLGFGITSEGLLTLRANTRGLASAPGTAASVTSTLPVPNCPCVVVFRSTNGIVDMRVNDTWHKNITEDDPLADVATRSVTSPDSGTQFFGGAGSNRFSGHVGDIVISPIGDNDTIVDETVAYLASKFGVTRSGHAGMIVGYGDSHIAAQQATRCRQPLQQLWSSYPNYLFYNLAKAGITAAEMDTDYATRGPGRSDIKNLHSRKVVINLFGANDLCQTAGTANATDNSESINTSASSVTSKEATDGYEVIEIEPYVRDQNFTFTGSYNAGTQSAQRRERVRMKLWGLRQNDSNVSKRIQLPASMRSWTSDPTLASGPNDATIQAITRGANYHTDYLHLNATGVGAVVGAGVPGAIRSALSTGGIRSRTRSRSYR